MNGFLYQMGTVPLLVSFDPNSDVDEEYMIPTLSWTKNFIGSNRKISSTGIFKIRIIFRFCGYNFLTIIDSHGVSSQKLLSSKNSIEQYIICGGMA